MVSCLQHCSGLQCVTTVTFHHDDDNDHDHSVVTSKQPDLEHHAAAHMAVQVPTGMPACVALCQSNKSVSTKLIQIIIAQALKRI